MALSEHFEDIRHRAVEAFLEDGFLAPVLYYLKGNKVIAMIPLLFEDHEKQAAHQKILKKARSLRVDGFIEASESWFVHPGDREPHIAPSKHPRRREGVMVLGRQWDGSRVVTQVRLYEIVRVGKQVDLVHIADADPANPETLVAWFDDYFLLFK